MDTEAGMMGETVDGSNESDRQETERGTHGGGRPVRVSYETRGFGLALVVDEDGASGSDGLDTADTEAGVLRVSGAVVTLEIPLAGGGRSVLSWDPAEVAVDPLAV